MDEFAPFGLQRRRPKRSRKRRTRRARLTSRVARKVTKRQLSTVMRNAARLRRKGVSQKRALKLAWEGVPGRARKRRQAAQPLFGPTFRPRRRF